MWLSIAVAGLGILISTAFYFWKKFSADAMAERFKPVYYFLLNKWHFDDLYAATVLAGLPLVLSGGAGAEARQALGWVIVGGLGLAAILTLYLTPVAFLLLAGLSKPRAEESRRLARELSEVEDGEGVAPAG